MGTDRRRQVRGRGCSGFQGVCGGLVWLPTPLSPSENDDGGEGHKTEEWPVGAQRDPESETVGDGLF